MSDDVTVSGPVFDSRAAEAAKDYAKHVQEALADKAADMVRAKMDSSFKHNEGKYVSSIHVEASDAHAMVTDMNAFVYGPWLEGVGSRNETTRFKGYHSMREAASEIDAQAGSIADEEIKPYVERMN